ncbi:hypothetical protein ACQP2T_15030 [Nonomuraea sp. CA-143628]|uniref:hypothetical protein n=1 Tax=Nonomuraea sp. CA-143628 TaxID=3239997 RepID=UPI003D8C6E12
MIFGVVDVRDVADLHLRAMVEPGTAGERFLAAAGVMSLPEIANLLRVRLGPAARRVPTRDGIELGDPPRRAGEPSPRDGRSGPGRGTPGVERESA